MTVFNLLTHTSGIPNLTDFDDYEKQKTLPATPASLIARFRDKPLEFQPGEKMSYSNSGYIVLSTIVEKASGPALCGVRRREHPQAAGHGRHRL